MKKGKTVTIEAYYLYDGFVHLILNDGKERHYKVNVGNGHEDEAIDYINSLPQTASSINEIKNKWDLTTMNESKETDKLYKEGEEESDKKKSKEYSFDDFLNTTFEIYYGGEKVGTCKGSDFKADSEDDFNEIIEESLNESLGDDLDKLKQDFNNMQIGDSVTVKNYKNGDIYKFKKLGNSNAIGDFVNVLGKNHMASNQHVLGWAKESLIYAKYPPKFEFKESLKEDLSPEEVGASSLFNDLLQREYEQINQYDSVQITLEDKGDSRFSEVLEYIKDDINIHIGMLQSCLEDLNGSSEQVDQGEQQADQMLGEGLKDIMQDFTRAKEEWDKLGKSVSLYDALEIYNTDSPNADPNWFAKPLYSKEAWDELVQLVEGINMENKLTLDEALFESRMDPEKEMILDAIDTFIDLGGYDIDPYKFGTDSWEELRDQVEMGIDYIAPEIAQCIKDYLEKDIQFDKKHPEMFEEDPEAEIRQDIYDAMEKIISRYE